MAFAAGFLFCLPHEVGVDGVTGVYAQANLVYGWTP